MQAGNQHEQRVHQPFIMSAQCTQQQASRQTKQQAPSLQHPGPLCLASVLCIVLAAALASLAAPAGGTSVEFHLLLILLCGRGDAVFAVQAGPVSIALVSTGSGIKHAMLQAGGPLTSLSPFGEAPWGAALLAGVAVPSLRSCVGVGGAAHSVQLGHVSNTCLVHSAGVCASPPRC